MCVLAEELPFQAVTGWISVLECLLPGVCGCLWLRLVFFDIK
jgi:hypothetical protein